MTCVATNTPIENLGGKIVWADIDPNTTCIDPADVERKITPATKAIMCVAWAGTPCDLHALDALAKRRELEVRGREAMRRRDIRNILRSVLAGKEATPVLTTNK
jgi:hypothetical protein